MTIRLLKPEYTIDDLADALAQAKQDEQDAITERRRIESLIVDLVGVKGEGSFSATGDRWKVTTTGKINRTVDETKLAEIWDELPAPLMHRLFPVKHSLNTKELHYVQSNEPEYFTIIARAVTAKPGKPQVKIQESK